MRYPNSRNHAAIALLFASASALAAQGSVESRPARLTGRVADAVGAAIVKAEVLVTNTSYHAETGTDGRFELGGLPAGSVEVIVRRIGFAPAKIPLELGSGEARDIRVLLSPVVMMMDSVSVVAEAPTEKAFGGFETRKARGFGTFITREQIEKKNPRVISELFRTVSGVRLIRENGTPTVVSSRLGTTS